MPAGATDGTNGDLVDVAFGRPWHAAETAREGDAPAVPVDPRVDLQVDLEVDLGLRFPIQAVSVETGTGARPRLTVSDDGQDWRALALDANPDGAGVVSLTVAPGEGAWARHVRVALAAPAGSPPTVRVQCAQSDFDLIALRHMLGVAFDIVDERPGANPYVAYRLVSADRPRSRTLVGLALYECGAFGNCLIQLLLAIGIARNLNLKYIKLPAADRSEVIGLTGPLTCGGITFIPGSAPLPEDGSFLSGMYFDLGIQQLAGELGRDETRDIVTELHPAAVQPACRSTFRGSPTTAADPHPLGRHLQHLGGTDTIRSRRSPSTSSSSSGSSRKSASPDQDGLREPAQPGDPGTWRPGSRSAVFRCRRRAGH